MLLKAKKQQQSIKISWKWMKSSSQENLKKNNTTRHRGTEKTQNKTKPYEIKSSDRNIRRQSYTRQNKIPGNRPRINDRNQKNLPSPKKTSIPIYTMEMKLQKGGGKSLKNPRQKAIWQKNLPPKKEKEKEKIQKKWWKTETEKAIKTHIKKNLHVHYKPKPQINNQTYYYYTQTISYKEKVYLPK